MEQKEAATLGGGPCIALTGPRGGCMYAEESACPVGTGAEGGGAWTQIIGKEVRTRQGVGNAKFNT